MVNTLDGFKYSFSNTTMVNTLDGFKYSFLNTIFETNNEKI
jgi:hypothetical protein